MCVSVSEEWGVGVGVRDIGRGGGGSRGGGRCEGGERCNGGVAGVGVG